MISSEEGLRILRNWKTKKTLLWFVSRETSDMALGLRNVRVAEVSTEPLGVVFRFEGSEEIESLDLEGADFDIAGAGESPFPDVPSKKFSRFMYLYLSDGRNFVLAEYAMGESADDKPVLP